MRILHVIPSLATRDGGPTVAALATCRELNRRGEYAGIYTTNADGNSCLNVPTKQIIQVQGVDVTYFPINGSHYYKLSSALAVALRDTLHLYQVVHINSLYQFPSAIAAHYSRKYNIPYVLRPHGTLDPFLYRRHPLRKRVYEALIERRNLAAAAAVHFTTPEEMTLASSLNLNFRGTVIPHGVDIDTFDRATSGPSTYRFLEGTKVILFLGRINFKKGLDILARAFGRILRHRSDVHLVLAGPDTEGYEKSVRRWLAEEGALGHVTFTGVVEGEGKIDLLKRADLFALPSYSENFGIAIVEAMAAGLPVVVSDRVNLWPQIRSAGAGIVVRPDVVEVADAIVTLLNNPHLAREMGAKGHRLAREHFSWEAVGERMVRLYEDVSSGRAVRL